MQNPDSSENEDRFTASFITEFHRQRSGKRTDLIKDRAINLSVIKHRPSPGLCAEPVWQAAAKET